MAKDQGYAHYVCDRNQKHALFAKEGTPQASSYRIIKRYRSDGSEQQFLLCDECYQAYKSVSDKQDSDFNTFMSEGKEV